MGNRRTGTGLLSRKLAGTCFSPDSCWKAGSPQALTASLNARWSEGGLASGRFAATYDLVAQRFCAVLQEHNTFFTGSVRTRLPNQAQLFKLKQDLLYRPVSQWWHSTQDEFGSVFCLVSSPMASHKIHFQRVARSLSAARFPNPFIIVGWFGLIFLHSVRSGSNVSARWAPAGNTLCKYRPCLLQENL